MKHMDKFIAGGVKSAVKIEIANNLLGISHSNNLTVVELYNKIGHLSGANQSENSSCSLIEMAKNTVLTDGVKKVMRRIELTSGIESYIKTLINVDTFNSYFESLLNVPLTHSTWSSSPKIVDEAYITNTCLNDLAKPCVRFTWQGCGTKIQIELRATSYELKNNNPEWGQAKVALDIKTECYANQRLIKLNTDSFAPLCNIRDLKEPERLFPPKRLTKKRVFSKADMLRGLCVEVDAKHDKRTDSYEIQMAGGSCLNLYRTTMLRRAFWTTSIATNKNETQGTRLTPFVRSLPESPETLSLLKTLSELPEIEAVSMLKNQL